MSSGASEVARELCMCACACVIMSGCVVALTGTTWQIFLDIAIIAMLYSIIDACRVGGCDLPTIDLSIARSVSALASSSPHSTISHLH